MSSKHATAAAISDILNVEQDIHYYSDITKFDYHTHAPYGNLKFNNNDEIRLSKSSHDLISLVAKSFLIVEGKITCTKPPAKDKPDDPPAEAAYTLSSNAVAHMFDEIRFELAGTVVAKSRLVGITSTIKSYLVKQLNDKNTYDLAGFTDSASTLTNNTFAYCVPLKLLLPFFEDFQHVILNMRQELVLLRSATDINCIQSPQATSMSLEITKLLWKVPYIHVDDHLRLKFLKIVDQDRPLKIAFRKWDIHEYPQLPNSVSTIWTIKTASKADTPRFVILAFQTNRKNVMGKSMSKFDMCKLHDVKLFLNSEYLPYDRINGNKQILYKMFIEFAPSYYNLGLHTDYGTVVDYKTFTDNCPIIVLDCSHQADHLTSSTDIRLEMEFTENVPNLTTAYCILISDTLVEYKPLSALVREVQ